MAKFFDKLAKLVRVGEPDPVDPTQFNDPLAEQIDWTPLKGGGANFRTHKLIAGPRPDRIEFKPTLGMKLFVGLFPVLGLGLCIGTAYGAVAVDSAELLVLIIVGTVGVAFLAGGVATFYVTTRPRVFDKSVGYYWRGRKRPDLAFAGEELNHAHTLESVHAIQLLREFVRGNKRNYYSYELNLILSDGRRVNVVDHGNPDKLRADAQTLADFLTRPLWDAIPADKG